MFYYLVSFPLSRPVSLDIIGGDSNSGHRGSYPGPSSTATEPLAEDPIVTDIVDGCGKVHFCSQGE